MLLFRTMLIGVVAAGLTACDLITGRERDFDAEVMVGPVRTDGPSLVLPVTTRNTGSEVLTAPACPSGLERRSGDEWLHVAPKFCILIGGPQHRIAPGENLKDRISITDEILQDQSGEYRVRVFLGDEGGRSISQDMGVSEPFRIE